MFSFLKILLVIDMFDVLQGLVALTGVSVPVTVYSWVVILVLPVNAVVDPLLYSLSANLRKKVK